MPQIRPVLLSLVVVVGLLESDAAAQTLDPFAASFGPGSSPVLALAVQPDGRIVVGGTFMTAGVNCDINSCPLTRNRLARLLPDGSIEGAFNPGANGTVAGVAIQTDQKILVAGNFSTLGGGGTGTTARRCVGRLNANGTLDTAFDPIPAAHPGSCTLVGIIVQPDGKIIIAGLVTQVKDSVGSTVVRQGIARLNPDGSVDAAYYPGVSGLNIRTIALDNQGRLLVGGNFSFAGHGGAPTTPRQSLARFLADGTLDGSFNPGVSLNGGVANVESLAVQPDGSILVGGFFNGIGGGTGTTARRALARLGDTGAVEAFDPNVSIDGLNAGTVRSIVLQADGRILIAGTMVTVGGITRAGVARLEIDGTVDATFGNVIGLDLPGSVDALALQADGRILVGGNFSSSSAAIRNHIARYSNTAVATEALAATGGSTVTWTRGGTSPEVHSVTFEVTTDGVTWTPLGAAARIPGGWQLTGLSLPASPVVRAWAVPRSGVRTGSSSLLRSVFLPNGTNFVQNADFSDGTTGWLQFATPDMSYIVSDVTDGVFRFYRRQPPAGTTNQALVFRETGIPIPAGAPLQATFDLGNTDTVRKRISVLVHDSNFTDLFVCTFWLPSGAPVQTYGISTYTTQSWSNATISIYAASANAPANTTGYYLVDNVGLSYVSAGSTGETTCLDPTAPVPPGGNDGPELLLNGDFGSGTLLPGWATFGQITQNVTGGVFQFYRPAGTPAGVILQPTLAAMTSGEILTASFQLGNSSFVRVRVTVIIHDNDFSDLAACTFWLPAAQPLSTYTMRTFTTKTWTNTTFSVYPSTVGNVFWTRLDNVSLRRTPGASSGGVGCFEPGASLNAPAPPLSYKAAFGLPAVRTLTARSEAFSASSEMPPSVPETGAGTRVLRLAEPIDVGADTWLRFRSRQAGAAGAVARVEVSDDGVVWDTVFSASPWNGPVIVEIDLAAYAGQRLFVRFVFDSR